MQFLPLLILPLIVLWFVFLGYAIAWLSGWWLLARFYRTLKVRLDVSWSFQSAKVSWCDYNNCLTIGVDAEGILIVPFFLIRPGHAPLFLPWNELAVERKQWWRFSWLVLTVKRAPKVPIRLSESLAKKIASVVPELWKLPNDEEVGFLTK